MTVASITQAEADRLLKMEKFPAINQEHKFPDFGGQLSIDLINQQEKEDFILNYTRGNIKLEKRNHLIRSRKIIVLARLDLDGPPHRNPDGEEIEPRHLHLYREGYADKWAFPVPDNVFSNLDDAYQTLEDFMRYCNIIEFPRIERSLFT